MPAQIALNATLLDRLLDGRYVLNGVIGRGGSAIVYRGLLASDPNREVALKVFSAAGNNQYRETIETELAIAHAIRHPNIIRLFEALETESMLALVMEYAKLGDLSALIYPKLALSIAESVEILIGVARGLVAIHAAGFIHCDLTARNILLSAHRTPKISDFSIAKKRNSQSSAQELARQHGTFDYVSPEFLARAEISEAHDIYALGALAYELVTGRLPFSGAHIAEKMSLKLSTMPHPTRALRPDCPHELSNTISNALQIEPRHRLRSAKLFERQLIEILFRLDPKRAEAIGKGQTFLPNSLKLLNSFLGFMRK